MQFSSPGDASRTARKEQFSLTLKFVLEAQLKLNMHKKVIDQRSVRQSHGALAEDFHAKTFFDRADVELYFSAKSKHSPPNVKAVTKQITAFSIDKLLLYQAFTLYTMSFLFGNRPQLSSAEKIAAAETEVELISDMFNR